MDTNENDSLQEQMFRHLLHLNKKTKNNVLDKIQQTFCCSCNENECCQLTPLKKENREKSQKKDTYDKSHE